jgi:hypothetical protein
MVLSFTPTHISVVLGMLPDQILFNMATPSAPTSLLLKSAFVGNNKKKSADEADFFYCTQTQSESNYSCWIAKSTLAGVANGFHFEVVINSGL